MQTLLFLQEPLLSLQLGNALLNFLALPGTLLRRHLKAVLNCQDLGVLLWQERFLVRHSVGTGFESGHFLLLLHLFNLLHPALSLGHRSLDNL
ncbi:hypothetical protein FKM82_010589 [Ascaphus truei]